jgi:tetratricopeptide (TPR) repeat protein
MLAQADLARYAGQFVWLELNFDKAHNHAFLTKYGANATPTFFIINSKDGRVAAMQTGAMSLTEFEHFLDRGKQSALATHQSPADAALRRGDALHAVNPKEAAAQYRRALQLAPADWQHRELAEASLAAALQANSQWQECAETSAKEASAMSRDAMFGRVVMTGIWCVVQADPAPWVEVQAAKLKPLAEEGLSLQTTVRDHRDELYRTLMYLALSRDDKAEAAKWGNRWLDELDTRKPANDEERSAIDIARVENIQAFGDPHRVLPALLESERAMPGNWNASLRVAQMELAASKYDQSVAACDRGLSRNPGAGGQSWLLRVKADALSKQGKTGEARKTLERALQAARNIPSQQSRNNNINIIEKAMSQLRPEKHPTASTPRK